MEKLFNELAEAVREYGSLNVYNDVLHNQPYVIYHIKTKDIQVSLEENNFSATLEISLKRKPDDESYIIVKYKAFQNSFAAFIGEWSGRGDFIKTPLDINDDNLQKILHSVQLKLAKLNITEVIKEKLISDFSQTLQYALYTEHVEVGKNSYVPQKVVHISQNILKWLVEDPVELGWISENLNLFSFESLDEIAEVIKESKDFKYYYKDIEQEFGYQLVIKKEGGSLWVTCRKV